MLSIKDQKYLKNKFNDIYSELKFTNELYVNEIIQLINNYNKKNKFKNNLKVTEKTTMVISYGNSITDGNVKSLKAFNKFFKKYLNNSFNTIHFLPFYPSSSDSGFAVKDHYKIDPRLGSWGNINNISKNASIMADLVINHCSSQNQLFKNYLNNTEPGSDFFISSKRP